jgi:hypothetical protein
MNKKTLIYIAKLGSTVIDSQVLYLLQEIKKRKVFSRIIFLAGVKGNADWSNELSNLSGSGLEVILYRSYPNYSFFDCKQKKEFFSILKRIASDNTVIHLRGEVFCQALKQAVNKLDSSNVKVLIDVRGAGYEETLLYNKLKPVQHQLKLLQSKRSMKSIGQSCDSVSCVSEELRQYVLKRTIIDDSKVYVNHCIAGDDFVFSNDIRLKYRDKLGIKNEDVVFVFVTGSNSKWQNAERIINSIIKMDYKILNLSKQKIHMNNVINTFVPYSEVPNYLNAADIAIVWRNDDIVNNVASPVKFSEYVCCGLPVIANNGVYLINDYISNTGYGETIKSFEDINKNIVSKLLSIDRSLITENAKNKFSSEVNISNYLKIYDKILN